MFELQPPYTVQHVYVNDIDVLRKLAAHMGIGAKIAEGIVEFEVHKPTLESWVLGKLNRPDWYDADFFHKLIQNGVDRFAFSCPPVFGGMPWTDLPSEVLF